MNSAYKISEERFPILGSSPIREAAAEIRTIPDHDLSFDRLKSLKELVGQTYPKISEQRAKGGEIRIKLDESAGVRLFDELHALVFASEDGRRVVQSKLDGLVVSRLAPYEHWKAFRTQLFEFWEAYKEVALPRSVTRIGVRYINIIDLKTPVRDLQDFLTTVPSPPPRLPQAMSSFLSRIVIPDERSSGMIVLTESMEPSPDSKSVPILLDIDVFREFQAPYPEEFDAEVLEKLHDAACRVFFESVTERTVEMYT